jgi:hypothetical protein
VKKLFAVVFLVAMFFTAGAVISSAKAQTPHPAVPPFTPYTILEIAAPNLAPNSIEEIHIVGEVKGFSYTNEKCYVLVLPSFVMGARAAPHQ